MAKDVAESSRFGVGLLYICRRIHAAQLWLPVAAVMVAMLWSQILGHLKSRTDVDEKEEDGSLLQGCFMIRA